MSQNNIPEYLDYDSDLDDRKGRFETVWGWKTRDEFLELLDDFYRESVADSNLLVGRLVPSYVAEKLVDKATIRIQQIQSELMYTGTGNVFYDKLMWALNGYRDVVLNYYRYYR